MNNEIQQNLIDRSHAGDVEAFSEIYFRFRDSIYGFAYRLTGEAPIAEDITQETFMFFVEFPEKFDSTRGTLFAFLCGVARNKVLNYWKKSGTRLESNNFETEELEKLTSGNGKSPLGDLLDKEFSAKVEECLENLSPLQREVLILREIHAFSYGEIAAITGSDIGVVKSRLFRARQSLARELRPYLKTEKEECYEVR